ncbi:efflux RND transporter periplasmic adaptor subunit [Sphingobacterium hotanense]|uniref:efflux RND transporter periplasmic adaptor subunit n=1 Tax=Sphingobacterium hotanense TaxID=649196 RepID=UPI0021A9684B|nr:efflux RND transporter periplasmic adaptor subunit [Sphingobacterium hotanense]MCT1524544.1 efflux RND transporter periplasmic adaptor subunit [Sphingobacterium hotanense]
MKMTTNRIFCILLTSMLFVALSSCGNKKEEKQQSNKEILEEIKEIKAVGKVVSAKDWTIISSNTSARIKELMIKDGDSVSKGQLLMQLEAGNTDLDVQQAQAQLNSLNKENRTIIEDIRKAKVYADELKDKYETSKRLYEQEAETKEKMTTDYSSWQQQELTLKGLQQKQQAQQASAYEQQLEIQKAQNTRSDFQIIAASSGVITDLVAKVGQSVQVAMELGKIIDVEQPMVEAEVDELFVNDVKVGQSVLIFPVGRKDQAANGRISYLSPILSEKSILYETANEGQDRRVRKIKIEIEGNNVLTINSKVDCTIRIR